MSVQLRQPIQPQEGLLQKTVRFKPIPSKLRGLIGEPLGGLPYASYASPVVESLPLSPIPIPGANLKHAINYYADYGGCGFWRMYWPEHYLNAYQKAIINGLSKMILEPRFYSDLKAVKLQRQATPIQHQFMKFLKMASTEYKFKIIYEIDDIVFRDDIPDYNRCKDAFKDPKIVESILAMMQMVDEISVTTKYMKDYYIHKTGNTNITVVPNYPPKGWIDRFYDMDKIIKNYQDNQKRPRIGYCGSGTHIDQANRTGYKDDFAHVVDDIIRTRRDFKWVFLGCHPIQVRPFIYNGEMEFHSWSKIYDYPSSVNNLNLNAVVAPLADNIFNRAKSNIKYLEASCLGIPGVFQNLDPYNMAPLTFNTGSELIDQLKRLLKDISQYKKYSKLARSYAETMFLENENNLMKHYELYFTNIGSSERKFLVETN